MDTVRVEVRSVEARVTLPSKEEYQDYGGDGGRNQYETLHATLPLLDTGLRRYDGCLKLSLYTCPVSGYWVGSSLESPWPCEGHIRG